MYGVLVYFYRKMKILIKLSYLALCFHMELTDWDTSKYSAKRCFCVGFLYCAILVFTEKLSWCHHRNACF